jgi:hypothetical protein
VPTKELLEAFETFCGKNSFPHYQEKIPTILRNFIHSKTLLSSAECLLFFEQDPSDPTCSVQRLFQSMESTAQFIENLKHQLNTAQTGDSVLMPIDGKEVLVEFRKTPKGFDARVYTANPEYLVHHETASPGQATHYFPLEYTEISDQNMPSLVDSLAQLSIGTMEWHPRQGFTHRAKQEERIENALYDYLEKAAQYRTIKRSPHHLLPYHCTSREDSCRLVNVWLKQYCFERGAEIWYRHFRTDLLERRGATLSQCTVADLPDGSRALLDYAIEAATKACTIHRRKENQRSWGDHKQPRLRKCCGSAADAPTPPDDSSLALTRDRIYQVYALDPQLPLKVFKDIPCECGHTQPLGLEEDEESTPMRNCYSCYSTPVSKFEIQNVVDWDVGCLNRIGQIAKKLTEGHSGDEKRFLEFSDRLDTTRFNDEEYLRSLLLHLEQFKGPPEFPQELIKAHLSEYAQYSLLRSFIFTAVLKAQTAPSLFNALVMIHAVQRLNDRAQKMIQAHLAQLGVGEQIIIPFSARTHRILIEFDPIDSDHTIATFFNSGRGLEYHERALREGSDHQYFYPRMYIVPTAELEEIVAILTELSLPSLSWSPCSPRALTGQEPIQVESLYDYFESKYQKFFPPTPTLPYREQTLRSCKRDCVRAWIRDFCFRRGEIGVQWYREFSLYCLQMNTQALAKTLGQPGRTLPHLDFTMQLAINGIARRAKKVARPRWAEYVPVPTPESRN